MYIPVYLEVESNLRDFVYEHRINKNGQILILRDTNYHVNPAKIIQEKPFETFSLINKYDRLHTGYFARESVMIKNGYPEGKYFLANIYDTLIVADNDIQGLSGVFIIKNLQDSILYKTTFKNGSGYWKDFYYGENSVKVEGNVKNNFKVGEWKYYSKEGELDSLKNYDMTDSIDVRFPYCLFNKKEPCF